MVVTGAMMAISISIFGTGGPHPARGRRRSWCATGALLVAIALPVHAAGPAAAPVFAPKQFFLGTTEGIGQLKIVLRKTRATRTVSVGRIERDGALVLDQTVEQEGAETRRRQWRLREVAPGRFSGTITDAQGEVTGVVAGDTLHLAYRMKSGEKAEHWIQVAPDGRSAHNHMVVTKFGMSVATLKETIRRTGR